MGKNPIYSVCPLCILVPFFMNRNDYSCVFIHVCVFYIQGCHNNYKKTDIFHSIVPIKHLIWKIRILSFLLLFHPSSKPSLGLF